MEGKKVIKVIDINTEYIILKFDDGSALLCKTVSILSTKEVKDLVSDLNTGSIPEKQASANKAEVPDEKPKKVKEPEPEPEEEEEGEELTVQDLIDMDFDDLTELCTDSDLDTDPDEYSEEEVEDLRKAIAEELGFELPAKGKKKGGKPAKKVKEPEPEEEEEPEEEGEEEEPEEEEEEESEEDLTWDDLIKLDFDELGELCDEEKLSVDPDDYDEGDEDKFRRAIAEELEIEAPKVEKRNKNKK